MKIDPELMAAMVKGINAQNDSLRRMVDNFVAVIPHSLERTNEALRQFAQTR